MLFNLTSILTTCTLISCVSLVAHADDTKRPSSGNTSPLSLGNGSVGSGNSNEGARDGDGSRAHGLDGERWQDRVPRQPMWFINAGAGVRDSSFHPEDNARGFAHWWRGENAVSELIKRIQAGYDIGARRFFINRPMGTPGNTYVPGASWLTLSDTKRDVLPELLTDALLDQFDEPVHVVWFVGADMSDPRAYPGWTPSRDEEFYQMGRDDTWEQLIGTRVTLGGWISTGASGLAIDNSSPMHKRDLYLRLFEQLNQFPFNLAVYGEAYPLMFEDNGRIVRDASGTPIIDQEYIESMPWLATSRYIDGRWPVGVETESLPFDEYKTRMFVWLSNLSRDYGDPEERVDVVNAYMDRGLIPITYDPIMFRAALERLNPGQQSAQEGAGDSGGQASDEGSGSSRRATKSFGGTRSGSTRNGAQSSSGSSGSSRANLPKRYTRSKKSKD